MKKYLQIMKGTCGEYMMYRLSFVLWRVRVVLQVLVVYYLWSAIFTQGNTGVQGANDSSRIFGFTKPMILSYILLAGLVRTFVLGTTTMEIGMIINRGDLSNYLIKPLNFFSFFIAKDIADKVLNFLFAVFEISIIYFILRPELFIQTNLFVLSLSAIAIAIGIFIYFSFSMILSMFGFWTPDYWAPRFLSFVIIEFFAGGLFPLDILPYPLGIVSQYLPFSFFIYFPLKVYLGQLDYPEILQSMTIGCLWGICFWFLAQHIWRRGLKQYTAEGK